MLPGMVGILVTAFSGCCVGFSGAGCPGQVTEFGWSRTLEHIPIEWKIAMHVDGAFGGSYSENDSRLSDIALMWMADAAEKMGLKIDWRLAEIEPAL